MSNSSSAHFHVGSWNVQFNLAPIALGLLMGAVDAGVLPLVKHIHSTKKSMWFLLIPMFLYSLQPLLFYYSLKFSTMTSMNLMWDLSSDILITFIGIFILKEKLGLQKGIAVGLSILAIFLFTFSVKRIE